MCYCEQYGLTSVLLALLQALSGAHKAKSTMQMLGRHHAAGPLSAVHIFNHKASLFHHRCMMKSSCIGMPSALPPRNLTIKLTSYASAMLPYDTSIPGQATMRVFAPVHSSATCMSPILSNT